jgi:hypothetical protein
MAFKDFGARLMSSLLDTLQTREKRNYNISRNF